MKNTIKLTIPFSFKGQEFTPSANIDLDEIHLQGISPETLCYIVATENNIGNYSYEYEVLHASPLQFSDATGLAELFLKEDNFDIEGFIESLSEAKLIKTLQKIAKETMGIDNLEEHEMLKEALFQAYQKGISANKTSR